MEALKFRASYGESFRAPVFPDLLLNNTAVVINAPDPNAPDGNTIVLQVFNGNPDLVPEEAETWTAGFSFSPPALPGLAFQANYYQIDYVGRIDRGYPGSILTLFFEPLEPFAPVLTFDPTPQELEFFRQLGEIGNGFRVIRGGRFAVPDDQGLLDTEVILDNRVRNVAATSQEGLDFNASYSIDADDTRINLSLAGQYIIDSTRQVTRVAPESEAVNVVFLPVDLKMRGGMALSRRNLSGGLFVNYVDSYRDPSNLTNPKVDSWTHVDLNLEYDFGSRAESTGERALR